MVASGSLVGSRVSAERANGNSSGFRSLIPNNQSTTFLDVRLEETKKWLITEMAAAAAPELLLF